MDALKLQWTKLCEAYSKDAALAGTAFELLLNAYGEKQRHYHTIEHITSMLVEIETYNSRAEDLNILRFAAWFHDAVYDPKGKGNEKASAVLAARLLEQLSVPAAMIKRVEELIMATASHTEVNAASDPLIAFFLDCDLKVLGAEPERYKLYAEQIREEYSHVPYLLYAVGRKKVLRRFLAAPFIYRTDHFKNKYEQQARINIQHEIETL
ncbi:MAG: hypothetical protein JWO09_1891 [Bacteroidetes bacterium]|nr:hypothetical protein [Bacteroidota bacterium]